MVRKERSSGGRLSPHPSQPLYLAGYLLPAGILRMVAPGVTLDLLFAERTYEPTFMRLTGLLLFVVGVFLVLFAVVALGLVLTGASLLSDRGAGRRP